VESTIASAACGFNIKCTKIFRDKFGYICATDKGHVRLQRPARSQAFAAHGNFAHVAAEPALLEYIAFQHVVKERLHESGIGVDRFLVSAQGTPYFVQGTECFVASYAQTCPNAAFAVPSEFLAVVAVIAQMHAAVSFAADTPPYHAKTTDAGKQLANLSVLKRKLLRTGKFSEFDMLFLKGCDALAGHIEKWAANADAYNPLDNPRYFCHNLLKEENVYNDNGAIIITNFSECGTGHYLLDLAYLIKRCLKTQPAQLAPLDAVLDTYHRHHPAADFQRDDFNHILLYPDKFVKVTADYYSKKRAFAPKTYISRIEECLLANDEMKKYIG